MLEKPAFERLSQERKQELIEKTIDLYLELPYGEVTIRRLVAHLDINMNTFYRYFDSKDDFYLYILLELYHRIEFRKIGENESLVKFHVEEYAQYFTEKEARFLCGFKELPVELLHRFYFELSGWIREYYVGVLEKKKAEGELRPDVDIDFVASLYVTSGYNLFRYWCDRDLDEEAFQQKKDYLYHHFFLHGIMKESD